MTRLASVSSVSNGITVQSHLSLRVIIVGCGIGGLSAAICLGQAGHTVIAFESASTVREIGAGIQLSPSTFVSGLSFLTCVPTSLTLPQM